MAEIMPPRVATEEDALAREALRRRLLLERERDPATAETTMGRGWDAAVDMSGRPKPARQPARGSTSSISDAIRARLEQEQRERSSALAMPSPDHGAITPKRVQAPGGDEVPLRGFTPYHTPESGQRVETQFRLEQALKKASPQEQKVLLQVLSMAKSDDEVARILDDHERGALVR
jgi:hypothetical protein